MLIIDKLKQYNFSTSEKIVADYIISQREKIKDQTTKQIAKATFTSPSTLVRIAQKLNYSGWNELKEDYLKEIEYLNNNLSNINANIPFTKDENIISIASKIASLTKESIEDTLSLITYDDLQTAIKIINKSSYINIFSVSVNLFICNEFKHNMARIKKRVDIHSHFGDQGFAAALADKDSCAILISYSGENPFLKDIVNILKQRKIPLIAITSIGENSLSKSADCILRISTREKLYSKIANFSTSTSIQYLLNTIYSCIFAQDYDNNLSFRIKTSKVIEASRFSTVDILKED